MSKKEIKNIMHLTDKQLQALSEGESIGDLKFVDRNLERSANGFDIDLIIFKKGDSYYKYLVIQYLDQRSFTKPFEVFKETKEYTRTTYCNWVDDPEGE